MSRKISRQLAIAALVSAGTACAAAPATARADSDAQVLQGTHYACRDASYMQLFDSAASDLVKHEILRSEQCWKPIKGLRVDVLERIGKFARVRYTGNGILAYTYAANVRPAPAPAPVPAATTVSRLLDKVKRVSNVTEDGEVLSIGGKPTVFLLLTGPDTTLDLTIVKDKLAPPFHVHAENQDSGVVQVSVSYRKEQRGLGKPDFVDVEVLERDDARKVLVLRVSGQWPKFDRERNRSFEIQQSVLRITGKQFDEAVRVHTAAELSKPFRSRY